MSHTPGPWVQHPSFTWIIKQDLRPIGDLADGVTICNTTAHENSGFFPSPDEGRANARLIACAPDMLTALVKAREELACGNVNSAAERIAHAIERATGGAA